MTMADFIARLSVSEVLTKNTATRGIVAFRKG
jgi:hypothetical protein